MSDKPLGPIMVVDDDPDVREITSLALETHGYRTITAHDGDDCVKQLCHSKELPSLILLDMMMGTKNGWDVWADLSCDARLSKIPVIIITGNIQLDRKGLPAASFLRKPVQLGTLLDAVEKIVGPPTT